MSYRVSPISIGKGTAPKTTIHRSQCIWAQYDWPGPFMTKAKAIAWAHTTGRPVDSCQRCDP